MRESQEEEQERGRARFRHRWSLNLTELEVRELSEYEFGHGTKTVAEELRRYYLKLKSDNPESAEKMLAELGIVVEQELSEEKIKSICRTLYKYWNGFLIHYQGKTYTKSDRPVDWDGFTYVD